MKRLFAVLFAVPLFAAGVVPNRYIVELSTESVAAHARRLGRGALLLHTREADLQRTSIRLQQAAAILAVRKVNGTLRGTTENVKNALLVEIADADASQLASIPGVAAVYPERLFHLTLDHAVALHQVPGAWSQVGISNAGAGIRIAMIDTGIDNTHPGFQDAGFTAPVGFPLAGTPSDLAFTNNKVIVARSYASLFAAIDPDTSARDHVGHGTATGMAAAGVSNAGPLATISGVAPQAYLGSYKVFGTPGVNDSASESAILKAIDDAVADGMDVINMSLTTSYSELLSYDPLVQAVEQAAALGVVVVVSAGNYGPDPETIGSPAGAPHVISVGASNNDRLFSASVSISSGGTFQATPGAGANSSTPITAPLVDVSTLDGNGLACAALPANSLSGSVAFILRGTCTFLIKLTNAQAAGAVGALVYDNVAGEDPVIMAVGNAALPAEMVGNADGLTVKQQIAAGITATLQFSLAPFYTDPARLATFSSKGPNVDSGIKPDLVAVGQNFYTAAQSVDSNGALYSADRYINTQGTSFSAPLVAGAAALLKQARPGLTVDQYRSLLIDSTAQASLVPGTPARVQEAGTGVLNMLNALNVTASAAPVSLSFGAGDGNPANTRNLTLYNLGTVADQFQISVVPRDANGPVPQVAVASVSLDPGASTTVPVAFNASALAGGQYEGYIAILGGHASVPTRVPYWYGVPTGVPSHVTVLDYTGSSGAQQAGSMLRDAVLFRITDASGLPVTSVAPEVSVVSGGGSVSGLGPVSIVPNAYTFSVRLGRQAGSNVFQIQAGTVKTTVTIVGQ